LFNLFQGDKKYKKIIHKGLQVYYIM